MSKILTIAFTFIFIFKLFSQPPIIEAQVNSMKFYPETNQEKPALYSPFCLENGKEYVIANTSNNEWGVIEVSLSNERGICQQLVIDSSDFPILAITGLHDERNLMSMTEITGRTLNEISILAKPGGLSSAGFIAEDEAIRSVLINDNRIVKKMGLTHPQLATPLFHVLNMMDADLEINRWNMAKHEWENIRYFFYNGNKVNVKAYDTKGGQKSIFDDGIMGAFHIKLWRELGANDRKFLKRIYNDLDETSFNNLIDRLSFINIGEIQPQYIMRYGFYEGHTFWRADPVAIAYIFGLKSIEELYTIFGKDLKEILFEHHQHF